tara:strand:+ start:1010 stop:2941 length:1932 start_codon:yes stop_codon:yes gene_type:complete
MLVFLFLAGILATYAFWVYLRVELTVPAARSLAVVRASILSLVLLLLFDPRLPFEATGAAPTPWVLLDASMSMTVEGLEGSSPAEVAAERAAELETEGWEVFRFGNGNLVRQVNETQRASEGLISELAPSLQLAAESGAKEVRVLSDLRFTDPVAIQSVLDVIPVAVQFEDLSLVARNSGIARFSVSDVLYPEDSPAAEIEIFGGNSGDSVIVEIFEENREVAQVRVLAPGPGLRATGTVRLPPAGESGHLRYTARIADEEQVDDAFPSDDEAVTYAGIGYPAGALVLVSAVPDWEPRYLLPVLEKVTGLPSIGYLRAGPDRFVRLGSASDRGIPADSSTVKRAATEAALLVLHGLGVDADPWIAEIAEGQGQRLVLPLDSEGTRAVGLETGDPISGEWYASPDVPTSPIAGALAGVTLQGLPPLSGAMVPSTPLLLPPLQIQLRGAGSPESAFGLIERPGGRVAVALASQFWRWAARENGHEPYRRIWSGIVDWLLAGEEVIAAEPRPMVWVTSRGQKIAWSLGGDSSSVHLEVWSGTEVVTDTTLVGGGEAMTGALDPGLYTYTLVSESGDTVGAGRFDVSGVSLEMLPVAKMPELSPGSLSSPGNAEDSGRPLRTYPWVYLLIMVLLCSEWIVRRRTGLR